MDADGQRGAAGWGSVLVVIIISFTGEEGWLSETAEILSTQGLKKRGRSGVSCMEGGREPGASTGHWTTGKNRAGDLPQNFEICKCCNAVWEGKKKFLASFVHIGEFIPGPCNDPLNCSSRQFSLVSPQRPFFCDRPFSFAPSADLSASAGGKRKKSWLCSAPVFGRWPGHLPSPRLARTNGSLLCSHSYCPDLGVSSGGNAGGYMLWARGPRAGPAAHGVAAPREAPRFPLARMCAQLFQLATQTQR